MQRSQHRRTLSIMTRPEAFVFVQLAEVKEQAERRIAKLNSALQSSESRCHQLAAEAAAAAAAPHAMSAAQPQASQVCHHVTWAMATVRQPCDATYLAPCSIHVQLHCTQILHQSFGLPKLSAQELATHPQRASTHGRVSLSSARLRADFDTSANDNG